MEITILLIVCILLLAIGLVIISIMMIKRQEKNDVLFKELIESTIKGATLNSDTINMRLLSLATEVILNAPALTQEQIDSYSSEIKERDRDIVTKILGDEEIKESFDPFKFKEENVEETFEPNDILLSEGAAYNQSKGEGK
ncbi:MAG: hypothetical protein PHF05_00245 [Candidatus Izemoplasmatales bacterium]|nr:hypothetical protein [Candidatus Izemoplasmatales bacterium]